MKLYKYFIDYEIDSNIKETYKFHNKVSAYNFLLTHSKDLALYKSASSEALVSATLYELSSKSKKVILAKKNLTKVFK